MKLTNQDIALAMELRTEGITWKIIAEGLGVTEYWLKHLIPKIKQQGMRKQ